ncbi:hypothetical protein ACROYT_G025243 [Oculina patagonica]
MHSSSAGGSWADGSSLGSYKNWATGEPNYSGSNGACVAVKGKSDPVGKWYDDSCTSWKMYICEKPADVEVNECAADPSPCHINAVCSPTVGSYICKCKPGFTGDGKKTCADVNECADPDRCHVNATCTNTVGLYTCECKPGFTGNGINCEDVDECAAEPGLCDINADCTNTVGSYTCECKPGFTGDGKTCEGGPVQWEPKGCYRDLKKKKKVFVKSFYAALVKKMSPPPIGDEDKGFKATFELCRKAAEEKKLDLDVIGIAIKGKGKKRRVMCMRTRDGQPPKSGNYGKDGKKACKVDNQGFGVGVRPRVNFVYINVVAVVVDVTVVIVVVIVHE